MNSAIRADGSGFSVRMQQQNLFNSSNACGLVSCNMKLHLSGTTAAAAAGVYNQLRLSSPTVLRERFLPRTSAPAPPETQLFAARRKKNSKGGSLKATNPNPIRPPSLFVKQSPVPSRRPLRCVPLTNVLPESSPRESKGDNRRKVASSSTSSAQRAEKIKSSVQVRDKAGKVSKWASLFDAGGGSAGAESRQESNADAWFDKIFPKNSNSSGSGNQAKESESLGSPASPRLSPQQEKSIQQLQSLVKTLGVATRNSVEAGAGVGAGAGPARRRNKPNKLRPAPVQGGAVDSVPFSSILKKLQTVSSASSQEQQYSKQQEQKPARFKAAAIVDEDDDEEEVDDDDDDADEDEDVQDEEDEDDSEMEIESAESSSEDEGFNPAAAAEAEEEIAENLSKMTVASLRSLAKERGLTGYSKMKKDELLQLLS